MQTRVLAEAIVDREPGANARRIAMLRRKYDGDREAVDLLALAGDADAAALEHVPVQPPRAFVRCFRRRTRFHLLRQRTGARRALHLTARAAGGGAAGGPAALLANGTVFAVWSVSADWTTVHVVYDTPDADASVDEITIVWPDPAEPREARASVVSTLLAQSTSWQTFMADVYTCWGEIQSFTASIGAPQLAVPALAVIV
jgi:hypothetical protein